MDSKIQQIISSHEKLLKDISSPSIFSDHKLFSELNSKIEKSKSRYILAKKIESISEEITEAKSMLNNSESALDIDFYNNVITLNTSLLIKAQDSLRKSISADHSINNPAIIEIRAGAGGNESSLFCLDLLRMYLNYFKNIGWQVQIIGASETSLGGYKEVIVEVNAIGSYSHLRFESGVHRVQRIPTTETSGRIHTSAVSVVVYPQVEEHEVKIDPSQIEVFTYRSSGPGGQSVNTTDSAIRITHKPTGITVTCQDSKSQLKNKEKALKILRGKLYDIQMQEANSDISELRKSSIKSGDRSDKIRTYNFPQNRVTDHRVNITWHGIESIMNGDISTMISDIQSHLLVS